ncbi:hypothetical protein EIQ04_13985 [Xanthomonas campestris pv. raphani]
MPDVTALPHESTAVGARLRAMGRHRNSFIARKRAPTCCVPPSRMAVTVTQRLRQTAESAVSCLMSRHSRTNRRS